MVSNQSIVFMVISLLLSILFPLILAVWFHKKYEFAVSALFIGALVFAVFQLFTRIPMLSMLSQQPWYKALYANAFFPPLFLGITAGLFEEIGRYIGFRYLLKDRLEWKNGVAFGIGHGGIESIVVVGLGNVNALMSSLMINSGTFDSYVGSKVPAATIEAVKNNLLNTPSMNYLVGGIERVLVITIHIALSILVLYAVKNKKGIFLLYAIALHSVLDIVTVFMAMKGFNIWLTEVFILACAVIALIFIRRSGEMFLKAKKTA